MRFYIFFSCIFLYVNSCVAQNSNLLNERVITKFIEKNKEFSEPFLTNNFLYLFGVGKNFEVGEIKVVFLNLESVKKKVEKDGEFNLIKMNEIEQQDDYLKVSFNHLRAKKNDRVDFIYFDNFNSDYCIKFDCETNSFNIFWCGEKYE